MARLAAERLIYANRLGCEGDVSTWIVEGKPKISFRSERMVLENGMDEAAGQAANFVYWCPEVFPADIVVQWKFRPVREPGLAMFWFAATGTEGRDLFDPSLAKRTGEYRQYNNGDVNAYHLSYFRRKNARGERDFHTCNLRKSKGFHLVAQGADPIPSVEDVLDDYTMHLAYCAGRVVFSINGLRIFDWQDDGTVGGPRFQGGRIGFRQMAPMVGEYSELTVHAAVSVS